MLSIPYYVQHFVNGLATWISERYEGGPKLPAGRFGKHWVLAARKAARKAGRAGWSGRGGAGGAGAGPGARVLGVGVRGPGRTSHSTLRRGFSIGVASQRPVVEPPTLPTAPAYRAMCCPCSMSPTIIFARTVKHCESVPWKRPTHAINVGRLQCPTHELTK